MLSRSLGRIGKSILAATIGAILVAAQDIGHLGIDSDPAPLVQARRPVKRASSSNPGPKSVAQQPPRTSATSVPPLAPTPPVVTTAGPSSGSGFSDVLMRAEAAARAERYDSAITEYRKAVSMNRDSLDAQLGLAESLYDAKRYPEAEKEFKQALSLKPNLADAQRGLGDTLYELRRYTDAVAAYSGSEQAGIKDAELYNNFANALFRTRTVENKKLAIDAYRKAIALKPDWSDAHAGLANALRTAIGGEANRNLDEALTIARKAVELNNNSALAHSILGRVYADMKDSAKALAEGQRAVELAKNDPFVYVNLGGIYYAQGKTADAEKAYQTAISLDRRWALPYHSLGTLYLQTGKLSEASAMLSQAVLFEPDSPTSHSSFGAARARSNDYNEAINQFNLAIKIDPKYVAAYHNLGSVYAVQRRFPRRQLHSPRQ